jgi:transposase
MRRVREILRLAHEGVPLRQIGAALGVPFTTAGDHVRRAERAGLGWPLPDELDDVALEALLFPKGPAPEPDRPLPDWRRVHRELRRPGLTLMLLWHEYREDYPDGYSYSQFCLHYRGFERHLDLPMRQEHRAGERLFVDFPGQLLPIYDRRSGDVALEAELFVAVLGASSYLHAEAVASQGLEHWIGAHVHTFEALGCVPRVVVHENVPRHIFRRTSRGAPARPSFRAAKSTSRSPSSPRGARIRNARPPAASMMARVSLAASCLLPWCTPTRAPSSARCVRDGSPNASGRAGHQCRLARQRFHVFSLSRLGPRGSRPSSLAP